MATKKKAPPAAEIVAPPALAEVLAKPLELPARLAYAKSLGADPLGEYIELCARCITEPAPACFELVLRAEQLFRAHRSAWLSAWGRDGLYALGMFAGLPSLVHIEKDVPVEALSRALSLHPVTELRLRDATTACVKALMKTPGRERVRTLALRFDRKRAGQATKDLLTGSDWPQLESVHFADSGWEAADVKALLERAPLIRRVSGGARPGIEGFSRLQQLEHVGGVLAMSSPILANVDSALRSLGAAVLTLDTVRELPQIEQLSLGQLPSREAWSCFPNLKQLSLPFGPEQGRYREPDIKGLADGKFWEQLESLRFEGHAGSLELFTQQIAARCQRLRRLHVRSAACLPELLARLGSLEALGIDSAQGQHNPSVPITDELIEGFAPQLRPSLRELEIRGDFTSRGVSALLAAGLDGLEVIKLASSRFDAKCVELLLKLPKLRKIYLSGAYDHQSIGALREQSSQGRYLGPPPTMTGPQRDAVWSHELVAPAL